MMINFHIFFSSMAHNESQNEIAKSAIFSPLSSTSTISLRQLELYKGFSNVTHKFSTFLWVSINFFQFWLITFIYFLFQSYSIIIISSSPNCYFPIFRNSSSPLININAVYSKSHDIRVCMLHYRRMRKNYKKEKWKDFLHLKTFKIWHTMYIRWCTTFYQNIFPRLSSHWFITIIFSYVLPFFNEREEEWEIFYLNFVALD